LTTAPDRFARLVSLACHDLRTPLATIHGFARTLARDDGMDERSARFLEIMGQASDEMTGLLDVIGIAARIESGRWEPALREADTLELVRSDDERVAVDGHGAAIETEPDCVSRALGALALAAIRHGPVAHVAWHVEGRDLQLMPVVGSAAPVLTGEELRDLGSEVARLIIFELGGSVILDGERLLVRL
jgi:signal transduction histidine kinase